MDKAESSGLGNQHPPPFFAPRVGYVEKSLEGVGEYSTVGHLWTLFSLFFTSAFTALADNHISHNSSLGYLGTVESKVTTYPAPPQVPPTRYSPIPRHMLAEEDFTR